MKKLRAYFAIPLCMELKKLRWDIKAYAEALGIENPKRDDRKDGK